eukprot:3730141-Pleurochrysis_carterae.AAC.1
MLERADKLAYYAFRTMRSFTFSKHAFFDSRCTVVRISLAQRVLRGFPASLTRWTVIRTSAQASFARTPKAASDELKEAMKLHVVGLIFHGKPDVTHLFPAAPHLAGNSNLNC